VGTEVRPTQPLPPLRIVNVSSGYSEDLETFGMPDTVSIEDILSIDVTPLASGAHATSCPDMSVAASKSVDPGTSMSVDFDDRTREIKDTSMSVEETIGARRFRYPSLAPNVGRASLGDPASGTHPLTAQGYTSLGDTASGMITPTALGRYTDPDDSLARDRFWTCTARRSRDVDSGSDFSITELDSRSELDSYFAERGTRRDSSATVSASTQVRPHTWTPMVPGPSQIGPYLLSDIGTPPS